jgi:predicted  nucleic acid-binding Zn-ribbon protein
VKEVGDVPLDKLLEDQASWKGRAQTILLLKKKLEDLKSQTSPVQIREESINFKKEKLDAVLQELESVKESLGDQTRKSCTLKARNKVLELEISRLRQKMSTLLLKIEKDNEYIQALQKKVSPVDSTNELEEKVL